MSIKKDFSKTLKELREGCGLSQTELADIIGISRGSISFYENADRAADIETLYTIAKFFNVSTDYLLGITKFRNYEEASELIESVFYDNKFEGLAAEFSMMACRKLKDYFEKSQHFYIEKMHQGDNGCGNLFFYLYESVDNIIELFDKMIGILQCARDTSDRDEALKVFTLFDNSKLKYRIIEELIRIDREKSAEQTALKSDSVDN